MEENPLKVYHEKSGKMWKELADECGETYLQLYRIAHATPKKLGEMKVRKIAPIEKTFGISLIDWYANNKSLEK